MTPLIENIPFNVGFNCNNIEVHELNSVCPPCSYNPYDGPNEHPEAELPLVAGKYLYVYGTMDEDGFYEGMSHYRTTLELQKFGISQNFFFAICEILLQF